MNIFLEKNDIHSTLTTWIYCSYWQAWAAEQIGRTPYFHWPSGGFLQSYEDKEKFSQVPNAYDWYFIQPYFDSKPERHATWTWETPNWGANIDVSPYQFFSQSLADCKAFYKKTLKFNDEVNARGQQLVDKYQIDFSKTIGVTWRGTDIYLDGRPYLPIETYFPFIDDILNAHPDFRIICTAEETQILDPLLKKYNAVIIEEFEQVTVGGKSNPERFSHRSGFERGLQPVLMVWLFSKCAHYIKNRSSTGMVASFISEGSSITLGCDAKLTTWVNGKPFDEIADIDGVIQPLYR